MNTTETLNQFGVLETTLSNEEKKSLDEQGYVILKNMIDQEWLEDLRNSFEIIMKTEGFLQGRQVSKQKVMADVIFDQFNTSEVDMRGEGLRKVGNIVNEDSVYERLYTHPKVLAAVYHAYGRDFKLSSMEAVEAVEGEGFEELHSDYTVNTIWLLDDFTEDNGAPRITPLNSNQEEVRLTAPAGSVCIINSGMWYGGTKNHTVFNTRALHCDYAAREQIQKVNQKKYIRQEIYERISPVARYILDVN